MICALILYFQEVYSQNQDWAHNWKEKLIQADELDSKGKILIYLQIASNTPSQNEKIQYAAKLLELSIREKDHFHIIKAHQLLGVAHGRMGNLEDALRNLYSSAKHAKAHNLFELQAEAYLEIGATFSANNDLINSLRYENRAIQIFRKHNKIQQLAISLLNTGYTYYSMAQFDSALLYFDEAGPIFDSLKLIIGQAYNLGNRALVYWKTGRTDIAKRDLLITIDMLTPLGDQYGIADFHNQLGNIFLEEGNDLDAIYHLKKGLQLAMELGLKDQISQANLKLSELHESQGNSDQALQHYKDHIAYRDSVINLKNVQEMADMRTEHEVSIRESEITTLEREKELQRTYVAIAFILLVLSGVVILYFRQRFYNTQLMAKAERKEHEDEIHDLLKSQETKALQSMVKGKEEERQHLAKELHNHLGSLLATVKVNLNGLDEGGNKLDTIISLVDQATQDVRNMSHELHMGVSENFGLIPALQELVNHLQRSKQIRTKLSADLGAVHISSEDEILIYRMVQELVSNVLKHAGATQLTISLTGFEEDNLISIMVEDNGKGFDPKALQRSVKGIGLYSLEAMILKLQGEIHIDSSSGRGTIINVDIPFAIPENQITS